MELTGEQLIPLPQADVWRGLIDPDVLKASVPGCESIEQISDTEYKVLITAAVGPVKAKFTGRLVLSDVNPPNSYSLAFDGSGGAAGFSKGSAQVSLSSEGENTRLRYSAKASVGGKIAQVGSRLIDSVAAKLTADFFARFNETLAPKVVHIVEEELSVSAVSVRHGTRWILILGGIVIIGLLVLWLLWRITSSG